MQHEVSLLCPQEPVTCLHPQPDQSIRRPPIPFLEGRVLLDFCLTVHHQLGKVIQMNQLDATMIYWSIRSAHWMTLRTGEDILIWRRRLCIALYGGIFWRRLWTCRQTEYWMNEWRSTQHVSGNILPIIRSVRLRYLQHMVSCCCGG